MRKLVSFMHVSLDGYVAGPGGEMNWIKVDEEIFEFAGQRTRLSDTALYGRITWQMMEAYWPTAAEKPVATKHDIEHSAWYSKVPKLVLSRTMKNESRPNTRFIGDNVNQEITNIKKAAGNEIIIFGSPSVAHTLTLADLIDEYWLFINPIILGKGIPMFPILEQRINLKLIKSHAFESGVVCLHYGKV